MRVLIVDQDSASNEAIVRSLREHYTVDAVTNKGDCLDLLRSNTFEVVVATERLDDGSGLELLGQIGKKWPSVLRIFAADRARLQLLRGRLGPFELFQTLAYPIDPERLIATLDLATAAQDAHADTSNIQHVVLTAEAAPDPEEAVEETEDVAEAQQPAPFPAPRPLARLAPRERPLARPASVSSPSRSARSARREAPAGRNPRPAQTRAPKSAGVDVRATARSGTVASGGTARHSGRLPRQFRAENAANRPAPVRFPPLEATRAASSITYGSANPSEPDSLAEAAALASTYSGLDSFDSGPSARRVTVIAACAAAALLVFVWLGVKLSGSRSESPQTATVKAVTSPPNYPPEVSQVLARIESALKTDDFATARTEVDRLRQLAPAHPRLAFFEGLLVSHAVSKNGASQAAAGAKHSRKSRKAVEPASESVTAEVSADTVKPDRAAADNSSAATTTAVSDQPAVQGALTQSSSTGPSATSASAAGAAALAASSNVSSAEPTSAPPSAVASSSSPYSVDRTALSSVSEPASAPPKAATSKHVSTDDPPPVVREAKLLRRVDPEYPSSARRDAVAGSVDLAVVVSDSGTVREVSVLRANPPGVFDKSALSAVRKWKYDPRYVDGLPAEAHLTVHLEFGPNR